MDLLRNLFKGDRVIWMIFTILCVTSVVEVFSASSTLTYNTGDHLHPISTHLGLIMLGGFFAFLFHKIPCKWFGTFILLLPLSWIALASVLILGAFTNGAKRWIELGGIQFQPSEFAKMGTIISVAFILSLFQEEEGTNKKAFKYIMIVTGVTCALIVTENLSTAVLLAVSVFMMMFVGRVPYKQLGKLVLIGIAFVGSLMLVIQVVPSETWDKIGVHRMVTWKNRFNDHFNTKEIPAAKFDIDNDAQVAHANIAIATSHIIGKGPGNSVQRDFLSQAFSDFIYAIIIEELGLIGGAAIAILYIVLLMRIGKIARNCDKSYYAFLVMGFGILIATQAMFNMLVAVGIMPVTGQPLPLISKGGTSTIVNCIYIGMILSISQHVNKLKEEQQQQENEALQRQAEIQKAAIELIQNASNQATVSDQNSSGVDKMNKEETIK